jgi:hypothetical protein
MNASVVSVRSQQDMLAIRKKKLAELKANIAQQNRPTPHGHSLMVELMAYSKVDIFQVAYSDILWAFAYG